MTPTNDKKHAMIRTAGSPAMVSTASGTLGVEAMASGLKKKPEKKQEGSLPITFSMTSTYTYDPLIEIYTLV